ncbi:MAG: FHA domain-containing protein [Leptospira sp.]|nr:FHA domain-containing protein [Leptospira sp.]
MNFGKIKFQSIVKWGFVIGICFSTFSHLQSKPTFAIEDLNSTRFPEIELQLRENSPHPLSINNLVVAEEMDGGRTIPLDLTVTRPPGSEPIQVVVSVQPTDSKAINQWSTDLVTSLSSILDSNDRLHVHIQEEKRFLFLKNRTRASLESGFILPSTETYTKTLESLSILMDNLAISGKKSPFLVVVLHSKTIPDKHLLVDLSKKARRMGIPIHILGFESRESVKLTEYTDGKHYNLKEKDSTQKLFDDILYYKKPPYRVSYTSRKQVKILEEKNIQIDIGILNVQNLSSEYKITFFTRLENSIKDPYIFIPSAIFFFLICISALILLPKVRRTNKKIILVEADGKETVYQSTKEIEEDRVYEQMYGKKDEQTTSRKSSYQTDIYESELEEIDSEQNSFVDELGGESYSKAVLIQKEGPSPGRQYNLYGHETLIGRLETNHLVIWDNSLSPVHARIKNIQNKFVLYDMLSLSGVYLNGKKLLRPKVLYDFDEILIGKTLLIFRGK